jgi:hypothetical protein
MDDIHPTKPHAESGLQDTHPSSGAAGAASTSTDLKPDAFVNKLSADQDSMPNLCVLTGYLGRSNRPDYWRLYLTPTMDEYFEIAGKDIRLQKSLAQHASELGGSALWVHRDAELTHTFMAIQTIQADELPESEWDIFEPHCEERDLETDELHGRGDLKPDAFVDKLVAEGAALPNLCILTGYLGRSPRVDYWRLYLTLAMDEYLEIAEKDIRLQQPLSKHVSELGGSALWVQRDAVLKYVFFNTRTVRAGHHQGPGDSHSRSSQDGGRDFHSRPSWRDRIRRHYPVRPGEHRRHIISYRYFRNLSRWFDADQLRRLGYDPDKYPGGVEEARRAWVLDRFNDPQNFWRGSGRMNSWLGRWMWLIEPFNWDFPTPQQAEREQERREEEQREREREERESREREERERREREERERRERQERERREREERERREREERERREREERRERYERRP